MREGDDDDELVPRVLCGEFDKNGYSLMRRKTGDFSTIYVISVLQSYCFDLIYLFGL